MIGGVLVERTIREVLPVVQRNEEGLEEVIARLNGEEEKGPGRIRVQVQHQNLEGRW